MLVLVLLASAISFRVSAITINPGTYFSVGNETYTVYQTMNFESITISSSYIIFNNTGFYVSSGNDIIITLVYINDDTAGAGDGEKVLEFYADTTAESVVFDLSGFLAGNNYTVNRSGSSIATPTANGSGFISFTNSVWSSQLFEISQVDEGVVNNPPVVSNIPDQTILEGASFAQIDLDNYVTDDEDLDEDIDWSYGGNTELLVSIVNRVATISVPNSDWYGAETITFTAEDTGGLTDSDDATFTVTAINDPPVVSNIPDQTILEGASFAQIDLDDYVSDVEDPDEDIDWSYSGNTDLLVSIVNRVATISTPNSNWYGVETITFTAEDTGGLTDSDDATFTVTAINDPPVVSNIPDQTILEGASFAQIDLDNYVTDDEDPDEDINWSYSGNTDLLVSIVNRVATISTPNSDWYGVETITFTAEDTGGLTDSDDATFMVIAHDAPVLSGLSISNGANDVSVSTSSLSITIEDPNGDSIDWTIETSSNIGSNSGNNDSNGSKSCSISGLAYSTTYHWFVNATDGTYWTNGSYSFTTESAPSYNPPPYNPPVSPPSSPPVDNDEQEIVKQNNPPDNPVKPSGPTFVEMGVEYVYMSSAFDVDGDQVRFRFDWGDGNVSDWSDFVVSNTSVSMSYYWSSISVYAVRVIAQDINGLNSSWSLPLNVIVSQTVSGETPPVADIDVPSNVSVNQTIVFDASGSFDGDGIIVSYYWEFGDGENGSSMIADHVYKNPGEYTVTLVVTDNNGNTFSKSIIVTVASEVEEEQSGEDQGVLPFDLGTILIGSAIAMILLVCLIVFFRNNIKSFVSVHRAPLFPPWKIMDTRSKMEKVNAKIEGLKKKMMTKTDFKLSSVGMGDTYPDEIQKRYDRICRFIDSEIASTSKEKDVFDGFDKVYTGEKVDKLIRIYVSSVKTTIPP